jgi:hypothetical protein
LIVNFSYDSIILSFVKVAHALAMDQFEGYDFVNSNQLIDEEDIQSRTKQNATKIDSIFISFHSNDKNKAFCIRPFIDNLNLEQKMHAPKNIQLVEESCEFGMIPFNIRCK